MAGFMKASWEFMVIMLLRFRPAARAWIYILMGVNLAALYFISTIEGRVVLVVFMVSAMALMVMYWRLGFVRLLGIGHVFWIPMLWWLVVRLGGAPQGDGSLKMWIMAVIVVNGISLILDAVDVTRYVRGERGPYYKFQEEGGGEGD